MQFSILSWNILQGGGSRIPIIINAFKQLSTDVLILSEFRNNASGKLIKESLYKIGYTCFGETKAYGNDNSVLIASKHICTFELYPESDPVYSQNIITANFSAFNIMGVYLPHKKKHQLFPFITKLVSNSATPFIVAGDYNTGKNFIDQKGDSFWYQSELLQFENEHYVDAFRTINGNMETYSWFSHQGNGFRYDHTYVHESLKPIIKNCTYLHDWRQNKWSDHAPMLLELGV
jgi:exodeoxyribonuclease III